MTSVFLSYRRSDSADFSALLYDRLSRVYGRKNLFKDLDSIPGGRDFRAAIEVSVLQSDVMLVIIGPTWLNATNAQGRRIDQPDDAVRGEIEMAMRHNKRIVPVLIDDTPMPSESDLPPRIQNLSYLQAQRVRTDNRFESDTRNLLRQIGSAGPRRSPVGMIAALVGVGVIALVGALALHSLGFPAGGGGDSTATIEATTAVTDTIPVTMPTLMVTNAADMLTAISECSGVVPNRLRAGMHGRVVPGETNNRLRAAPSLDSPVTMSIASGTEFDVIGDPVCADGFRWLPVRVVDFIGYTAEGNGTTYWVEPYTPSDATPEITAPAG